jgi:non-ribosomal peptide synthetase component F
VVGTGTTGRPKGVSVSHGNVTNSKFRVCIHKCLPLMPILSVVCTSPGNLAIHPGTRVSQLLNVAFDMCAWEVLATLTNGGTLVLRGSSSGLSAWHTVLSTVHVVISTPSILAQFDPKMFPNVRTVATAGERCPQKLADEWAIGREFWNCCGPTEVRRVFLTMFVSYSILRAAGLLIFCGG